MAGMPHIRPSAALLLDEAESVIRNLTDLQRSFQESVEDSIVTSLELQALILEELFMTTNIRERNLVSTKARQNMAMVENLFENRIESKKVLGEYASLVSTLELVKSRHQKHSNFMFAAAMAKVAHQVLTDSHEHDTA